MICSPVTIKLPFSEVHPFPPCPRIPLHGNVRRCWSACWSSWTPVQPSFSLCLCFLFPMGVKVLFLGFPFSSPRSFSQVWRKTSRGNSTFLRSFPLFFSYQPHCHQRACNFPFLRVLPLLSPGAADIFFFFFQSLLKFSFFSGNVVSFPIQVAALLSFSFFDDFVLAQFDRFYPRRKGDFPFSGKEFSLPFSPLGKDQKAC